MDDSSLGNANADFASGSADALHISEELRGTENSTVGHAPAAQPQPATPGAPAQSQPPLQAVPNEPAQPPLQQYAAAPIQAAPGMPEQAPNDPAQPPWQQYADAPLQAAPRDPAQPPRQQAPPRLTIASIRAVPRDPAQPLWPQPADALQAAHIPQPGNAGYFGDIATKRQFASNAPIHRLYTENVKKRAKKRKASFLKYALASTVGVVLGGAFTLAAVLYLGPFLPGRPFFANGRNPAPAEEVIRTYEIEKTDSPITAICEKVSPSIVGIRITATINDFFFGEQSMSGEGSGIIIRDDGYILTNNHVITAGMDSQQLQPGRGANGRGEAKIEVLLASDRGNPYVAKLVGRDAKTDLAVLKIDAPNLPAAELGDSDALRQGELVVAIGSLGGADNRSSVADGIVSSLNTLMQTDDGDEFSLIQTNAAINRGNSGGALVNSAGQVVGVNTINVASGYDGLGYAVPINSARAVADSLIVFNSVKGRPKIGIVYQKDFNANYDAYKKQNPDIPKGVYVYEVEPLSGAFKAGVKEGDILTVFNGAVVENYMELVKEKDKLAPGDVVRVEVYRDGKRLSMDLELSEDVGEVEASQ
jgi:serine protease Do